jgi:hypothetical protein
MTFSKKTKHFDPKNMKKQPSKVAHRWFSVGRFDYNGA